MSHPSKAKGTGFEREIVEAFKAAGFDDAKRAWGSNGGALGQHEEVDVTAANLKWQLKRHKKLPDWLGMTEHVDGVIIREDHGEAYVLFPLDRMLSLMRIAESAMPPR